MSDSDAVLDRLLLSHSKELGVDDADTPPDDGDPGGDDPVMAGAEELLQAINRRDPQGVAEAFATLTEAVLASTVRR